MGVRVVSLARREARDMICRCYDRSVAAVSEIHRQLMELPYDGRHARKLSATGALRLQDSAEGNLLDKH